MTDYNLTYNDWTYWGWRTHSQKFEKVQGYYDSGHWGIPRVRDAVVKSWITEAEYEEITGEAYA